MLESFSLTGRNALVTGASRGIAAAIVEALAQHGANVAIHHYGGYDERIGVPDAAEQLAEKCRSLGVKAVTIDRDITEDGCIPDIVKQARDGLGQIDIAVSSASIQVLGKLEDFNQDLVDRHMHANYVRTLELAQATLPAMAERGWGRFLSIGSIQQYLPNPQMPVYAGTKAAQWSLVLYLAHQFADRGVTVNSISPGTILTDRNIIEQSDLEAWKARFTKVVPVGRIGEPEDLQGAAILLCSDAGSYITGADIQVNGGALLSLRD